MKLVTIYVSAAEPRKLVERAIRRSVKANRHLAPIVLTVVLWVP